MSGLAGSLWVARKGGTVAEKETVHSKRYVEHHTLHVVSCLWRRRLMKAAEEQAPLTEALQARFAHWPDTLRELQAEIDNKVWSGLALPLSPFHVTRWLAGRLAGWLAVVNAADQKSQTPLCRFSFLPSAAGRGGGDHHQQPRGAGGVQPQVGAGTRVVGVSVGIRQDQGSGRSEGEGRKPATQRRWRNTPHFGVGQLQSISMSFCCHSVLPASHVEFWCSPLLRVHVPLPILAGRSRSTSRSRSWRGCRSRWS